MCAGMHNVGVPLYTHEILVCHKLCKAVRNRAFRCAASLWDELLKLLKEMALSPPTKTTGFILVTWAAAFFSCGSDLSLH